MFLSLHPVFLLASLCLLINVACAATETAPIARNVIVILADDLGYADVGYHGCEDIATPSIDRLAAQGVHFTNGYVTGSVCGPTRAGLLSGRYQQRLGAQNNIGHRRITEETPFGLPLEVPTLADRFKDLGFATACYGKWHLGGEVLFDKRLFPTNRGFDEFFGFLEGAARYEDVHNIERKYIRNETVLDGEKEYYTDAIGREALSFIERHKDERFFLYLAFNAVHAPMQAAERDLKRVSYIQDPDRRKLAAMLIAMDDQIGRVMQSLESHGLSDDTMVIFLSDNGGKPNNNFSLNHPLRGEKNQAYEGGIRVPFCIQWPTTVKAGSVVHQPVSSLDIFPTVLSAVGAELPNDWQLDGINLAPALLEKQALPERTLYWKENNHRAIRKGDWKLVQHGNQSWQLFNLTEDMSETTDLSHSMPERVQELKALYHTWDAKNKPAFYGHGREFPFHSPRVPR